MSKKLTTPTKADRSSTAPALSPVATQEENTMPQTIIETETPTAPTKRGPGRPAADKKLTATETDKPKRQYTRRNPELAAKSAKKNLTPDEVLKIPVTMRVTEFETLTAQAEAIKAKIADIREEIALAMDEHETPLIRVQSESGTTFELSRKMKVRTNIDKEALTIAIGAEAVAKFTKKTPFTETRIEAVRNVEKRGRKPKA